MPEMPFKPIYAQLAGAGLVLRIPSIRSLPSYRKTARSQNLAIPPLHQSSHPSIFRLTTPSILPSYTPASPSVSHEPFNTSSVANRIRHSFEMHARQELELKHTHSHRAASARLQGVSFSPRERSCWVARISRAENRERPHGELPNQSISTE